MSIRNDIIKNYNDLNLKRRNLIEKISENSSIEDSETLNILNVKIADLNVKYLDELPVHTISRCPYTGEIVKYKIDSIGFSGFWWQYENPMREKVSGPKTFFALDGAMAVKTLNEKMTFSVFPGPDKPFVIGKLLKRHEIKVVMSSINVAGNTTWLMVYYSYPRTLADRPNIYGSDRYFVEADNGGEIAFSSEYIESDYDYDISYWIGLGKVLWIKPGDKTLKLRTTIKDCPYVHLGGEEKLQIIDNQRCTYYKALLGGSFDDEK